MLFMRTENRYLRQHYLKGYKLRWELRINGKKINLVIGGLVMTCGKTFVELESVINLNKSMHLSFKNKQKTLKNINKNQ